MNRAGLIGFFLLPLAFAALPLIAMVVSASAGSESPVPRVVEVVDTQDQDTDAGFEVTTLGFTEESHLAADCGVSDAYGIVLLNES